MSFSEKLILIMLADIHIHLRIHSDVDAQLIRDAVLEGQLWALDSEYGALLGVTTPDSVSRKTAEILEMWTLLEVAFNDLSPSEQATFAERCASTSKLMFTGFDENAEIEYLRVAEFLIEKMDRFSILKGRRLGLHVATLARYDRMLSIFDSLRHKIYARNLNLDELISICWMERSVDATNKTLCRQ